MKNKEIEELLNTFKELINTYSPDTEPFTIDYDYEIKYSALESLLSYIEQLKEDYSNELEENYKLSEWLVKKQKKIEQLENRNKELYEGFMGMSDERCEYAIKCEQLENNRDKAIEILESIPINANGGEILEVERKVLHLLKGDSDD